jgi:hypothetical protein
MERASSLPSVFLGWGHLIKRPALFERTNLLVKKVGRIHKDLLKHRDFLAEPWRIVFFIAWMVRINVPYGLMHERDAGGCRL